MSLVGSIPTYTNIIDTSICRCFLIKSFEIKLLVRIKILLLNKF